MFEHSAMMVCTTSVTRAGATQAGPWTITKGTARHTYTATGHESPCPHLAHPGQAWAGRAHQLVPLKWEALLYAPGPTFQCKPLDTSSRSSHDPCSRQSTSIACLDSRCMCHAHCIGLGSWPWPLRRVTAAVQRRPASCRSWLLPTWAPAVTAPSNALNNKAPSTSYPGKLAGRHCRGGARAHTGIEQATGRVSGWQASNRRGG
jgi:hypothetical protein